MSELVAVGQFVARAVWDVLPAFLLSVTFGVLIRALRLDGLIRAAVEARVGWAVVLAVGVGAFSPLCSCTVVPVVTGLLLGGVPLAPVMAFWVASPTMDPEMFALTVATLGWPLALARLLATLMLSLGAGYLTLFLSRSGLLGPDVLRRRLARPAAVGPRLRVLAAGSLALAVAVPVTARPGHRAIAGGSGPQGPAPATACCTGGPAAPRPVDRVGPGWAGALAAHLRAVDWPDFGRELAAQSARLGPWLVLAFALEAVMLRYVPQTAIASVLGEGRGFAVVLAALVGIPLYLNNVSALPIVSGLLSHGMQPGAAVAFLIAGPVTTVPAMSAVWGVVRPRVFALYLVIALGGAIVLGYATNVVLRSGGA